jgi:hypothetical protein
MYIYSWRNVAIKFIPLLERCPQLGPAYSANLAQSHQQRLKATTGFHLTSFITPAALKQQLACNTHLMTSEKVASLTIYACHQ